MYWLWRIVAWVFAGFVLAAFYMVGVHNERRWWAARGVQQMDAGDWDEFVWQYRPLWRSGATGTESPVSFLVFAATEAGLRRILPMTKRAGMSRVMASYRQVVGQSEETLEPRPTFPPDLRVVRPRTRRRP